MASEFRLSRTTVDLARTESLENAVIAADAALAREIFGGIPLAITRDDLRNELSDGVLRGLAKARSAVEFADPLAGSPGESLIRVSMAREHIPVPVLQQRFDDAFGTMYVDFFWPNCGVIGEFDGIGKYLRSEWTDGRSPGQVVVDEKWREDRLRALGFRVVRWGWGVARRAVALGQLLRAAGVS